MTVPAALRAISIPTSVEPVTPLPTSGCSTSASPTAGPGPRTTLSTPGGSRLGPRLRVAKDGEERLAGFSTTVFPAAIAGAVFQLPMFSGKFHGVISAATPIGSRNVSTIPSRSGDRRAEELVDRAA